MKIFLTGGTGFIGSHFINKAMNSGHEVLALKRSMNSKPRVDLIEEPRWLNKQLNLVKKEDFKNVDVVVHFAAHSANVPYDTLANCTQKNVIDPLILFEKAINAGVKKFVVAGSCFEYGKSGERYDFIPVTAPLEPTQTYPASKALSSIAFNQFAIEHKIQLSYHRIFQVFGEGELETRLWPSLKRAAFSGENFEMTKGEQIRDFIDVNLVADEFLKACEVILNESSIEPKYHNLGSGNPQTILEFSKFWWNKWEAKGQLKIGLLPYRIGEVMRFVPELNDLTR